MVLRNAQVNPFDTLEEATKLLSVIPQELADRLILIGGQALLLWGEYYLIDKLTGKQLESLASDDLDFMGRRPEVEDCAKAWHGEARLPDIDDHTPQSGMVFVNNKGVKEVIDFLPQVYGISHNDALRFSDRMKFGENTVRVLSPPLCLKSRIENLNGLGYGEAKIEREKVRVIAAMSACYYYLVDICDNQTTPRTLPNVVTYIANSILLSPAAIALSVEYGFDFKDAFPVKRIASANAEIANRFLESRFAKYRQKVESRKERRQA